MSYEDKDVRDFCYKLMTRDPSVHCIKVMQFNPSSQEWTVLTSMGPPIAIIQPTFLLKLKKALGYHDSLKLRSIKGRSIEYIESTIYSRPSY